jgi:MFS family permease/prefoldin subunit 5
MLVRLLSWQWQFWLNIPLAIIGVTAVWWALADHDRPQRGARIDWIGAILLTGTLVSLNMALLGSAEIQSVNGLQELTGDGTDLRWLYPVALVAGVLFVFQQRHSANPLLDRRLFRGRTVLLALLVNFVVGAGLVIAMVDVPLFVNSVEIDLDRAAVISGLILSAMTAAMAVASYLGGHLTERTWFKPPVLLGLSMASGAYAWMGATWTSNTSYPVFALQLALLGAGFGLTVAPTANAVVDSAPPDQRGAAASVVMVVRLLGLSVGLSALTAWGLSRFNALRSTIDLPPLTDPKFESALLAAQEHLTAQAIAETFTAAAVVLGAGLLATFAMRRLAATGEPTMEDTETTTLTTTQTVAADDTPPTPVETADLVAVGATRDLPPPAPVVSGAVVDVALVEQMAALQKRTNLILGALGVLLAGALVAIALLFARVADAQHDAADAQTELATARADLNRVEAGAALYSSQIEGFQQKLVELRPQISASVEEAITGLRTFGDSTIEFPVKIDQVIPIDTEVVINRTVQVPIKTTIPINQSFDTTIKVDTPFGKIPVNVTVPVDVDVPVDLTVDIPINETVPIKDEIPVKLDVPVSIDVSQTQLKDLTDSIAAGLQSLQDMLTGLT